MKAFAAALICCRHPLRRRLPIQRRPLQWGHPASSNKLAGSLASLCGHQNAGPKPRALSFRCSNVTNGANGGGANDDAGPSDGGANPNAGDAIQSCRLFQTAVSRRPLLRLLKTGRREQFIQSSGYTCLLSFLQQLLALGTRWECLRLLAPERSLFAQSFFERHGLLRKLPHGTYRWKPKNCAAIFITLSLNPTAGLCNANAEIVEAGVDVLFCGGDPAVHAAQQVTRTVPAPSTSSDRRSGRSLIRRSRSCRTSPTRPSSPSKTRGCSSKYRQGRAISKNPFNSRPQRPKCWRSSVPRQPI